MDNKQLLQYARYCSNIYNNIYPNNLLHAYARDGFDAWVLDNQTEILIIIRGSDDWHDIIQDIQMVAGILPKYTQYAMEVFAIAVEYATDKQLPIVATGHSLGSSLAQYIAYRECINAYTFNAYGIGDCLVKGRDIPITTINKIQNYCIENDVVSSASMQWQLGKVVTWDIPKEMYPPDMSVIEQVLYRHSIDTIVELLELMVKRD